MGDFDDLATSAVNEAVAADQGGAPPDEDAGADTPAPAGGAEPSGEATPPQPPAGDGWRPPSREEWEAHQRDLAEMRQLAQIGQEFAPHADRIRSAFQNGFGQPTPQGQPQAEVPSPYDRDYEDFFKPGPGYVEFWQQAAKRPQVFERGVNAIASRGIKKELDAAIKGLKAQYEKDREELNRELAETRGFRRVAEHRFAESPRWKQHGKAVEDLFKQGIFNAAHPEAISKAFEYAERMAKAQGATPAQAQAAGAHAAQAVAAQAGGPAKKPEPRDEASLRGGDKRPAKPAGTPSNDEAAQKRRLNDPRYFNRLAEQAVRAATARATK